jgi:hypothetical protein
MKFLLPNIPVGLLVPRLRCGACATGDAAALLRGGACRPLKGSGSRDTYMSTDGRAKTIADAQEIRTERKKPPGCGRGQGGLTKPVS